MAAIKKPSNTDVWQELMDEAYDRLVDPDDKEIQSRTEMIEKVPRLSRIAVLLGNLNYQIENGGFSQWVENGYAIHYQKVLDALKEVGTPLAKKVTVMVEDLSEFIDEDATDRGMMGEYWINEGYEWEEECYDVEYFDEDDEPYWEEECVENETLQESAGIELADRLDDKYSNINEDFMDEVAEWFVQEVTKK